MPVDTNVPGAGPDPAPAPAAIRLALRLSAVSIVWTLSTSAGAVAIGIADHVLALIAFGLAGLLDAAGSATLVVHFRHALRHDVMSERLERRATLVVGSGLVGLGVATGGASIHRLATGQGSQSAPGGAAIAAAAVVVLCILAVMKRRVGRNVGSAALVADGGLSASGAILGAAALIGAAVGPDPGRWWVDPAAALAIAAIAAVYGAVLLVNENRSSSGR